MAKILFVNACVRPASRTCNLARTVLELLTGEVEELCLYEENIPPLDLRTLEKSLKHWGRKRYGCACKEN